MIVRNKFQLTQHGTVLRGIAVGLALAGLGACSTTRTSTEPLVAKDPIGYSSQNTEKSRGLDVPPDLTQLQRDNRYALPDAGPGVATASGYQQRQNSQQAATGTVALRQTADMRIERHGNVRWLVINSQPELIWPKIKQFWEQAGFVIKTEMPEAGIIETDWAENRAKIPEDMIRNLLGRVMDRLYSTGERDMFRTRIERSGEGKTEVFISHRGLLEVYANEQKDSTRWTARPSDPELEAEFLARLMVYLGAGKEQAKTAVTADEKQPQKARLVQQGGQTFVEVDEGFDHTWRLVGLALDRGGFTVEDRNRADGQYFVRYAEQAQAGNEKGFFARLFSSESDKESAQRYRIQITSSGSGSKISVQDLSSRQETSRTGERILTHLQEQLR